MNDGTPARPTVDPAIAAAYERAMDRCGRTVTIQRVNGQAPRTSLVSATVRATVGASTPDTTEATKTGYGSTEAGSISQDQRMVIVLARDLLAERFPLPVRKNDKVILDASGEKLNVTDVDDEKRRLGGAIEIQATGVS